MKKISIRLSAVFLAVLMLLSSLPLYVVAVVIPELPTLRSPIYSFDPYTLDTPSGLFAEPAENGIKVSWNAVSGASQYRVYYLNSEGMWKGLGNTTSTSFIHENLESGTTYTYTVRCLDFEGTLASDYDKQGISHKYIAPPQITSIANTISGINLKWEAVEDAFGYCIYKSVNGSSFAEIAVADTSEFTDSDVSSGEKYTYTVSAVDKNDSSITYFAEGESIVYLAAPHITKTEVTSDGIRISWDKIAGASGYRVYFMNSEGFWQGIGNTTSTSFTHTNLTFGKTYTYTVRCLDSDSVANGAYDTEGISVTYFSSPSVTSVSNTNGGVFVEWAAVEGISRYRVYKRTNGSSWDRVFEVNGTSYTDSLVTSGNEYTYTVRGIDANDNFVSYYTLGMSTVYYSAPVITSTDNTSTGTKITWEAVTGISNYRVYYINESGLWEGLGNTTSTSFVHDNLVDGKTYTYTVRCLDSDNSNISDYDRLGTTNTFYAPPEFSSIQSAQGGVLLRWDKPEGVYQYRVFRKTMGSPWGRISTTKGNYHFDKDFEQDTVYAYTLRYLDSEDKYLSEYIDTTRYFVNGSLANGNVVVNGNNLYFVDGELRSGFQTINGKKYYYGADGTIQKNGIVGSDKEGWYYAGSDGVCCENEEIVYAVKFVKQYGKGSTKSEQLRSCYNTLVTYSYERVLGLPKNGEDFRNMAIKMFRDKAGNCFCYGAAFACIAKVLGFESRVVSGQIASAYGGVTPHGWTQVNKDGAWLICDPDMQKESSYYNYYMCTYNSYPVKPLITEKTYTLDVVNGVSQWK